MGLGEERPPSLSTCSVSVSWATASRNWVSGKATDLRGLDVQSLQLHAAQDDCGLGLGRKQVGGGDRMGVAKRCAPFGPSQLSVVRVSLLCL